jgi:hypothetical protein
VEIAIGTRSRWLAALGTSAVLAAAGCSAASSNGGETSSPPAAQNTVGPGTSLRHQVTPVQVAAELVAGARVPSDATEVPTSPIPSLDTPPNQAGVPSQRIERMRWWQIDRPLDEVYAAISDHQSPDLHPQQSGSTNSSVSSEVEKDAEFTFRRVPLSIHSATFAIAVAPLTESTSAIGAYAVVIEQPTRGANETLPATLHQLQLGEAVSPALNSSPPGPQLPTVAVTGSQAQQIVMDFNELRVRPEGVTTPCPIPARTKTATFAYVGHTLAARLGACNTVSVTLDGNQLSTLNSTPAFVRDVNQSLSHKPITSIRRVPGRQ